MINKKKDIVLYYGNWSIYGANVHPGDIDWKSITQANYAFGMVGNLKPNADAVPYKWQKYIDDDHTVKFENADKGDYATGKYDCNSPEIFSTDPWADYDDIDSLKYNIGTSGYNAKNTIKDFITTAHKNNVKAVLSIGGWSCSVTLFDAMQKNYVELAKEIVTFITETVPQACNMNGEYFDGVDIDLEPYANQWGGMSDTEVDNIVIALQKIRAALDEAGSKLGKKFSLDFTIGAGPAVPVKLADSCTRLKCDLSKVIDKLQIMTYDYHGTFDYPGLTNLHSPWDLDPNEPTTIPNYDTFYTKAAIDNFKTAGFPTGQMLVGIPCYARAYQLMDATTKQPLTHIDLKSANPLDYLYQPFTNNFAGIPLYNNLVNSTDIHGVLGKSVKAMLSEGSLKEAIVNPASTVFAVHKDGYCMSYDNPETVAMKATKVVQEGLGGLIFWAASGDTGHTLVQTANNIFNPMQTGTQTNSFFVIPGTQGALANQNNVKQNIVIDVQTTPCFAMSMNGCEGYGSIEVCWTTE